MYLPDHSGASVWGGVRSGNGPSRRPGSERHPRTGRVHGRCGTFAQTGRRRAPGSAEPGAGRRATAEAAARKEVDGQEAFTVTSANETGALTSKPIAPWEKVQSVTVRIDAPSRVTVKVEPTAAMERVSHPLL